MATTPPDARAADDSPTAPPPLSMTEAYPMTMHVQLDPDGPLGDDRWRAMLVVATISGMDARATTTTLPVPGVHTGRDGALRAAAAHVASKLS